MASCRGIHNRYPPINPTTKTGKGWYSIPENCRCRVCGVFLKWDGNWCPCCGGRVSRLPKGNSYRKKILERNKIKYY